MAELCGAIVCFYSKDIELTFFFKTYSNENTS